MNKIEIKTQLVAVIEDTLDLENLNLADNTTANDVEGWDSLAHVRIVVATEAEFDIRFASSEVGSLKTIGGLVDLISSKLQ